MLVKDIKKAKKGFYKVTIDDEEYIFSEDTVVKFRMVEGHETSKEEIALAKENEDYSKYYSMAIKYSLRYAKGEASIKAYLLKKGVPLNKALEIVSRMKEAKVLNEDSLLDSLIDSMVRSFNGKELIKAKLLHRGFNKEDIKNHLDRSDDNLYMDCLEKLYNKCKHKYDKYDSYNRIIKIKYYLLQRGYSYSEIDKLTIN